MGRKKREVSHMGRGLPDTPAMSRRYKPRRLLTNRLHEAFPEEAEEQEVIDHPVKPSNPVRTSTKHVQCKSVFYSSRPTYTGNMTPDPEAVKRGGSVVKEEEQNLAVTPEGVTSSSSGTDATFSFDEDDEEDCYSSASSSSSSLPSPEIFRRENYVETLTFPMKEETLDLHLDIKNSTLLDVSHAQNIHMHDLPNISTISDASTAHVQTNREIRGPEAATQIQTDSFKSETLKRKTPVKLRRPILFKKKVSFKTPVVREVKRISVARTTFPNTSESARRPSKGEQVKPHAEAPGVGEMNSEDDTPQLRVTLKRPVKRIPEKARFFDFVSDGDRDLFFQRARERCVKLRSIALFSSHGC
ncbi:uncharacterized protein LOC117774312 [Hippoglossus hippoglossus]|uniref:uncharacterized protein LOC117774312 n=1 Tax=Hippoglossus hippoglossus TaxID=8267 RepID=UPI00148B7A64|nr:uncharacterized protein LOC117774312 [Hippoglossus hippoglossus]